MDPITFYHIQIQIQLIKAEFYGELQGKKTDKNGLFLLLSYLFAE